MISSSQVNRHIWRAYLIVGLISLLPKAAFAGREFALASHFGASDQIDAYLLALMIPLLLTQVTANAFSNALIPLYVRKREECGPQKAGNFASHAMGYGIIGLCLFMVLLYFMEPWLMPLLAYAFPASKQILTGDFFILLLPLILLQGLATMWSSLLTAEQRFALASLLPTITPVLIIAVLYSPLVKYGMVAIILVMLAGSLIEAVCAGLAVNRVGIPWPNLESFEPELKQMLKLSAPMLIGLTLTNSNIFVDQFFASISGSGDVAMLNYGNKAMSLFVALTAIPVSIAVLPYFSQLAAKGKWSLLSQSFKFWGVVVISASIPITALLYGLSPLLTSVFFPAFTGAAHASITVIQQYYLLLLPFYLLGILGMQVLLTLGKANVVLANGIVNFIVNLALDILLPRYFGLAGIALSTSLMYAVSTVMIFTCTLFYLTRTPQEAVANEYI